MSKPVLIPDKERDVFFKEYCKGANRVCIDCGSPNPQWATAYFGILFCLECSGKHRSLGTHLTFVRSISMDSWKVHEIAAMRAGGNSAMIDWWVANGVDPRAAIPAKYGHAQTQLYREKIKAAVAGKEFVPPPASGKSSLSSSQGKSASNSSSSSSLSKSTGSTSSGARKPKKKSSSRPKMASSTSATGTLFSFGDDEPSPNAVSDDSDDEAFESFVSAKPTPMAVPDYSDSRLRQYEGATSFGSDDLDGTKKAAAAGGEGGGVSSTDDIFAALSTGWNKFAQVATATKEKVVESTAGLKQQVEASKISERATSFIQSLWSGLDPAPEQQQQQQQQQAASQQPQSWQPPPVTAATARKEERSGASTWLDQSGGPKSSDADDGWGAWDGEKDDEDVTAPASGKGKDATDDSWGAWGATSSSCSAAKSKKKTVGGAPTPNSTPVTAKKSAETSLVDLDFSANRAAVEPASGGGGAKDGWDDWAFSTK